jgi:hypothetical protein
MDDIRVSSTSPLDAYRDQELPDGRNRKGKKHAAEAPEDEYVSSSGQAQDSADAAEDFYSPLDENKDSE